MFLLKLEMILQKGNLLNGIVKIVLELREVVHIKNYRITVWENENENENENERKVQRWGQRREKWKRSPTSGREELCLFARQCTTISLRRLRRR